jgi:phosphoribosylaminoimidazolecarboxamide formyltransferase/IMP cyclohydrolase
MEDIKIKTALISVYDKTGIVDFAKELNSMGIKIFSTSKTAKLLQDNNIKVIKIEDYTSFPEILDGRVKTLNYKIFAGILAVPESKKHQEELQKNNIEIINMVVVNLYPFESMLKKNLPIDEMIEFIDIGGNSLLRAAAKNFKYVLPVYDKKYYNEIIKLLKENDQKIPYEFRIKLASETFAFTSKYDSLISSYLNKKLKLEHFPEFFNISLEKIMDLRYGENPHQKACWYKIGELDSSNFKQLWGKELSYNNIFDLYAGVSLISELSNNFANKPSAVIIKHRNPCGVAIGKNLKSAYIKALNSDPVSAFGGIVVLNQVVEKNLAKLLNEKFYEIIVAKNFTKDALEILKSKKNLRIIKISNFNKFLKSDFIINSCANTVLIQTNDNILWQEPEAVTEIKPTKKDIEELKFAWIVCKYVKSNAIVYTKNFQLLGMCGGQTSRVDAVKFASLKSKQLNHNLNNSYLASDAFFPFPDSVKIAAKYKVRAIIQPGGSIRDPEVIKEANKNKIIMVFTKIRHFLH